MADLLYHKKSVYESAYDATAADAFAQEYMAFLAGGATERQCVSYLVAQAEKNGFKPFDEKTEYKPGDRFYFINRARAVCFGIWGKAPITDGLHIAAAHIDSPRLDVKPNPLHEAEGLAMLKTHYYGGIKKYQWTALPLALEGVVIRKDGSTVDLHDDTTTFCVSDLLPHLATEQMEKPLSKAIDGEALQVIVGSQPAKDADNGKKVRTFVMQLLQQKYGIEEDDFQCAELCFVPKIAPAALGFDKSLIGAYGQDDRVCAYTAFRGLLDVEIPVHTALVFLADKEEIGSDGVSGMQSRFFERMLYKMAPKENMLEICANSYCLSADVNAAYDPLYPQVSDLQNSCVLGGGPCVTKYTGSRGKSGTSDASAETMRYFIDMFHKDEVLFQTGELGKVDAGGGGTVAKYMANRDINTVDIGVGLLSMHAPFEISSKADVYMTHRAMHAFLKR